MVCEWGMSDRIGPVSFGENPEIFLGRDLLKERNFSEEVAAEIDQEMRKIIDASYERAKALLSDNREFVDAVAQALIEREVLEDEDLGEIMKSVGVEAPETSIEPSEQPSAATQVGPEAS